jgi:hypothetical protein
LRTIGYRYSEIKRTAEDEATKRSLQNYKDLSNTEVFMEDQPQGLVHARQVLYH